MRTYLFVPFGHCKIRAEIRGNKAFCLMPMCVENVPIPVRKKNAYRKEQPFQYAFLLCFYVCRL